VSPDLTLIDALREMHDHKYLHLPVRDDDGTVVGLVDVMELVCSTAGGKGGKGWRDFFSGAMNARDDRSDTKSYTSRSTITAIPKPIPIRAKYLDQRLETSSDVFSVGFEHKGGAMSAMTYSMHGDQSEFNYGADFDFKVIDTHGHLHKVRSSAENLSALKILVSEKVAIPVESLLLKYRDEEKDEVTLSNDASLKDAVEYARSAGHMALKLTALTVPVAVVASISGDKKVPVTAIVESSPPVANNTMLFVGGGLVVVAALGVVAFVLARKK
jgi:hypothetical protein